MRTLVAIVFSILIAGAQAVCPAFEAASASAALTKSNCACTRCETTCCPRPAGQSSIPSPSVPSSARQQLDLQGVTERQLPVFSIASEQSGSPVRYFSSFSQGHIPLYDWNCAYLI